MRAKMSDSTRKVDKDKGNWGHVRAALGCACIFPNKSGWQTCGSHLYSCLLCRYVSTQVSPPCTTWLAMSHSSHTIIRHQLLSCWFSVNLKFLILGVKNKTKQKPHNLWIYFYICPMFLFMKGLGTAVLYDIYLALKHLSCRFTKLGSLFFEK